MKSYSSGTCVARPVYKVLDQGAEVALVPDSMET